MSSSYYTFDYSNMGALSGPKGNNKQMKKNNFWVRNFVVIAVGLIAVEGLTAVEVMWGLS